MSENLTASQAPAKRRNIFATLAFLVAIAAIVLQALAFFLRIPSLGQAPFSVHCNFLITDIERALIALLLPMAAMMLRNSSKPRKAKLFVPLSLIFLIIQVVCAIVLPILLRTDANTMIFSSVSGSGMLNALIAFFRQLFRGGLRNFRSICTLLYNLSICIVGLCYMLKHLLCMIAFIKVADNK